MKQLLLIAGLFLSYCSRAQNVGIGTSAPASKLTISGSETTVNGLNAAIQIANTAPGGGSWYLRSGATGTTTPAGGFSIGNNLEYLFSMDNAGKLGLGVVTPAEKLHLNTGNIRLGASDKGIILNGADRAMITRGFDPFTSGVHNGLGRWGLFMEPNNLTLGIPNTFGKEVEVAKFNEDGTKVPVFSVSGEGLIKVFDDAGSTGQVLTSGGAANTASWQNAALTNNTRFSVDYSTTAGAAAVSFNTVPHYNLDPANIAITASGVTLSKAGLYHFEVFIATSASYSSGNPPSQAPVYNAQINIGPSNYTLSSRAMAGNSNSSGQESYIFRYSEKNSFEVYVPAGTLVRVNISIVGSSAANSYSTIGHLTGHLIAP